MDLRNLVEIHLDLPRLSRDLDELGPPGRLWAVRQWTRSLQATLWEATKGFRPVTLDDFVPPSVPPLVEVVHEGRNTLPAFTHFQKRFARLPSRLDGGGESGEAAVIGYNHQALAALTGPGYFVVHPSAEAGEIDIDYTLVPHDKPAAWPRVVPNSRRLAPLVYGGMVDVMRGVSSHVTIGRARKGRGFLDTWFVLVRQDARPS